MKMRTFYLFVNLKSFATLIMLFLFFLHGNSQVVNLSDSLRKAWSHQPRIQAKMDTRNSFITGRGARILGVKAGLNWNTTITLGLGYSWLTTDIFEEPAVTPGNPAIIRFRYFAPYMEYSFYKKGNWEARIPAQIGIGKSFLESSDENGEHQYSKETIVLYEPSMVAEYKVLNTLGFGGGIGYRIMLKNNQQIDQRFTSPVIMFWVRLIPDGIRNELEKMKEK